MATRVESLPEAVEDGRTGLLIPPDDVDSLAGALKDLLGDPARRREMGERAREIALRRFTDKAMTRSYEDIYRRLVPGWSGAVR